MRNLYSPLLAYLPQPSHINLLLSLLPILAILNFFCYFPHQFYFVLFNDSWWWDLFWSVVYLPRVISFKKTDSISKYLSNIGGSELGVGLYIPPHSYGTLSVLRLGKSQTSTDNLWFHIWNTYVVFTQHDILEDIYYLCFLKHVFKKDTRLRWFYRLI